MKTTYEPIEGMEYHYFKDHGMEHPCQYHLFEAPSADLARERAAAVLVNPRQNANLNETHEYAWTVSSDWMRTNNKWTDEEPLEPYRIKLYLDDGTELYECPSF